MMRAKETVKKDKIFELRECYIGLLILQFGFGNLPNSKLA